MVIGTPVSDLITIEAANIWGKLFLSLRLYKLYFISFPKQVNHQEIII